MSCCVAGRNGCVDLMRRAFALVGQVRAEWSKCSGSMASRAGDSVTLMRRSSAGWMPARMGRLHAGVGRRHPVTIRKASLMAGSISRVSALRHQTGAQYSAVECTRARVVVRRVVAEAPQPEPARRLRNATRDVSFLRSDVSFLANVSFLRSAFLRRCRRYVSDLSNVTQRYLRSEQKGRVLLLRLTSNSRLATLLLR